MPLPTFTVGICFFVLVSFRHETGKPDMPAKGAIRKTLPNFNMEIRKYKDLSLAEAKTKLKSSFDTIHNVNTDHAQEIVFT